MTLQVQSSFDSALSSQSTTAAPRLCCKLSSYY